MNDNVTLMDAPGFEDISLAELLGYEFEQEQDLAGLIFDAKNGEQEAMAILGEKFLKGEEVQKSVSKAIYWLQESDQEASFYDIASFYEKDGDLDRAEKWYVKAVEKDDTYSFLSMNSLCLMYLRPEKLNVEEAEYYLVRSLQALEHLPKPLKEKEGYVEYQNKLLYGAAGVVGIYLSKANPERALFWLKEEQSHRIEEPEAYAQKAYTQAMLDAYNELFNKDDISEELLKEAVDFVEPFAEKIGAPYSFGISDYYAKHMSETEKYFYWSEKAAKQGDLFSQLNLVLGYLGEAYTSDLKGVPTDVKKCRYYLDMARANKKPPRGIYRDLMGIHDTLRGFVEEEEDKVEKHYTAQDAEASFRGMFKKVASLHIGEGYTHVDSRVLSNVNEKVMKELTEITFADSVRVIGSYAFHTAWNVDSIKLPKNLRFLGVGAFDSTQYVDDMSFFKRRAALRSKYLHELIIPGNTQLEIIERKDGLYTPLAGIGKIDKLIFEEGHTEICWNMFHEMELGYLYVPDSVKLLKDIRSYNLRFKVDRISLPACLKDQVTWLNKNVKFEFRK